MSLETSIQELTKAVVALTEATMNKTIVDTGATNGDFAEAITQPAVDEAPVEVVSPEKPKKKKKAAKKKTKKSAAEALLDDAPEPEREEVIEEVEAVVTVTQDELLAEASRNVNRLGGDDWLRGLLEEYGYHKFSDISEDQLSEIFDKIKAKNDE
jgi:hypothetical protein